MNLKKIWGNIARTPLQNMKPEELTDLIDPTLEFVRNLKEEDSRCVNIVKYQNGLAILKVGIIGCCYIDRQNHIREEHRALEALEGVKGIPELYHPYDNWGKDPHQNYFAILKEYIQGEKASEKNFEKRSFQENMQRLIQDLNDRNVIIMGTECCEKDHLMIKGDQPYLIDLGFARVIKQEDSDLPRLLELQYKIFKTTYFNDLK